jgi:lipopolysaccharide transport system permease protein
MPARVLSDAPRTAWARNRELLRELVRRDLQARYRGSTLGIAWSLLNPLVFMIIYSIVFSTIMRFPTPGVKYPVFLLSGLLAWNFFSQGLSGSINSVLGNAALVKKVHFPWVLLTISAVLAAFVNYLISLLLLVPLMIVLQVPAGLSLVFLPVLVLLTLAITMGLSLMVAAGNVYFRDIEYLVTIVLQVMFFATPIIYQLENIEARARASRSPLAPVFQYVLYANPLTFLETSFQDVIAYHRWPQHWLGLGYAGTVALLSVAVGVWVFNRLQPRFAEEI